MLAKLRSYRPGHATVVAYLSLFVALGGSSYAALELSRNSVRSGHIAKGQVKRSDVARNAVDSARVRDGSLLAQDLAPGQLPPGERGEKGDRGEQGEQGERGEPASRLWTVVNSDGTRARTGSGVVSTTSPLDGVYLVTFDRDVSSCAYQGTLHGANFNNGSNSATIGTGPGPAPSQVEVETFREEKLGGTANEIAVSRSQFAFHLAVFC